MNLYNTIKASLTDLGYIFTVTAELLPDSNPCMDKAADELNDIHNVIAVEKDRHTLTLKYKSDMSVSAEFFQNMFQTTSSMKGLIDKVKVASDRYYGYAFTLPTEADCKMCQALLGNVAKRSGNTISLYIKSNSPITAKAELYDTLSVLASDFTFDKDMLTLEETPEAKAVNTYALTSALRTVMSNLHNYNLLQTPEALETYKVALTDFVTTMDKLAETTPGIYKQVTGFDKANFSKNIVANKGVDILYTVFN